MNARLTKKKGRPGKRHQGVVIGDLEVVLAAVKKELKRSAKNDSVLRSVGEGSNTSLRASPVSRSVCSVCTFSNHLQALGEQADAQPDLLPSTPSLESRNSVPGPDWSNGTDRRQQSSIERAPVPDTRASTVSASPDAHGGLGPRNRMRQGQKIARSIEQGTELRAGQRPRDRAVGFASNDRGQIERTSGRSHSKRARDNEEDSTNEGTEHRQGRSIKRARASHGATTPQTPRDDDQVDVLGRDDDRPTQQRESDDDDEHSEDERTQQNRQLMLVPTHEEVARIEEGMGILHVGDWHGVPDNPMIAQQLELIDLHAADADLQDDQAEANFNREAERTDVLALEADAEVQAANIRAQAAKFTARAETFRLRAEELRHQAEAELAEGRTAAARAETRALEHQYRSNAVYNSRYRLMLQARRRDLEMQEENES